MLTGTVHPILVVMEHVLSNQIKAYLRGMLTMLAISHIEVCFAMGINFNLVFKGYISFGIFFKAGNVICSLELFILS
jgi:hypothetical protein